jgi:hypothetical protein
VLVEKGRAIWEDAIRHLVSLGATRGTFWCTGISVVWGGAWQLWTRARCPPQQLLLRFWNIVVAGFSSQLRQVEWLTLHTVCCSLLLFGGFRSSIAREVIILASIPGLFRLRFVVDEVTFFPEFLKALLAIHRPNTDLYTSTLSLLLLWQISRYFRYERCYSTAGYGFLRSYATVFRIHGTEKYKSIATQRIRRPSLDNDSVNSA